MFVSFVFHDIYTGILDVKLLKPETKEYDEFQQEVRRKTKEPPFNYTIPDSADVSTLTIVTVIWPGHKNNKLWWFICAL